MRPIAQNRPFTAHHSPLIIHLSPLIVQKSVSYVLMSNPFGAICVNKKLRTLHADVPTPHNSLLTTHCPRTCSFCSFVEKYTKLYTKTLKTALKTVLYTPVQLPPPY